MDSPFAIIGLVFAVIIVFAIGAWYFSERQRTLRRLRAQPVTRIRDAVEGAAVKLEGTLRLAEQVLRAPISGRECAFYRVVIKQHRSSGKSSRWVTIVDDRSGADFLLEDETGRALVCASAALVQVAISIDAHQTSGTFNDATPELEEVLQRYGQSSTGLLGFNKALRYEEGVLEPGERVVALGIGRWEADPAPSATEGYRDKAKRLVVTGPNGEALLVADDPAAWSG